MKEGKGILTTAQMAFKCFDNQGPGVICWPIINTRNLARAARRFVRLEERQKHEKHLMLIHKILKQRHGRLEGPVVLPKHFGEMRFKSACRKTRMAG